MVEQINVGDFVEYDCDLPQPSEGRVVAVREVNGERYLDVKMSYGRVLSFHTSRLTKVVPEPSGDECESMGGGVDPLYGQRMDSADMGEC